MTRLIPTLMIDIDGYVLDDVDKALLKNPHTAGVILFKRNVDTPEQVRQLTDAMRAENAGLIIAADQEGGRVARLREGFSPLPAMGRLGQLYTQDKETALARAYDAGYVMAAEVLAVGIDISFAPVLDIDNGSLVIGDRAFHKNPDIAAVLSAAFIRGMNAVGMGATGKHFPGHGSVVPDSHVADACDEREFEEIWASDTAVFVENLDKLSALMPAHVVFSEVDDKPAGFSKIWLQDILRQKLGFDGVLFSDDLSMKAAHVAGGTGERVAAALAAGCDVALVCNDRAGVKTALAYMDTHPLTYPEKNRFAAMKSTIPPWQGDLYETCQRAFPEWQACRDRLLSAFFKETLDMKKTASAAEKDPTLYQIKNPSP